MNWKEKIDKTSYGIITALVLGIIGFLISFLVKGYGVVTFNQFLYYAYTDNPEKNDILILSLIPNMLMFYLVNFQWKLGDFTKGFVGTVIGLCVILVFLAL